MPSDPVPPETAGRDRSVLASVSLATGILIAVAAVYADPIRGLFATWTRSPMYSYGFTVPFVSLFLVYERRHEFAGLQCRAAPWAGLFTFLLAAVLTIAGAAAGVQVFGQIGLIVAIVATLLLTLGAAYVRTAWAALAYLLLMVPIWDSLTEPLHWPFQVRSAEAAVAMLHAVGVPVFREGTVVVLPNIVFEVARACSGINYLVAVLALGLPLAYLYVDGLLRRGLLIVSAIVIAAASNAIRVALIGWLAYHEVGSPLHGPFHVLHGLFVASIGYVALFAGVRLLGKRPKVAPESAVAVWPTVSMRGAAATLVALIAVATVVQLGRPSPVPLKAPLEMLPLRLGEWYGRDAPSHSSEVPWWKGADSELRRRYSRLDGSSVNLYVGYFEVQQQSKELVSFLSTPLHRASSSASVRVPGVAPLTANRVSMVDGRPLGALFWYEVEGEVETGQYRTKLRTLSNTWLKRSTSGAVVMLWLEATTGQQVRSVDSLFELAADIHQELGRLLPGRPDPDILSSAAAASRHAAGAPAPPIRQ